VTTPLVRVSYKNVSGSAIPPYGIFQLKGAPVTAPDGESLVFQADKPGLGVGPMFIDSGGGTSSSGDNQFGTGFRANEGFVWAAYGPSGSPPSAWLPIGPVRGQFYVNETAGGFLYAGQYDSTNNRVLIIRDNRPFWAETTSAITTGSKTSPSTFSVDAWFKSGSTWPYAASRTSDAKLQAFSVVNRFTNLSNAATGVSVLIQWNDEYNEWEPIDWDC